MTPRRGSQVPKPGPPDGKNHTRRTRFWCENGPRIDSKTGPKMDSKTGPKMDSKTGPKMDSKLGPKMDSKTGPGRAKAPRTLSGFWGGFSCGSVAVWLIVSSGRSGILVQKRMRRFVFLWSLIQKF